MQKANATKVSSSHFWGKANAASSEVDVRQRWQENQWDYPLSEIRFLCKFEPAVGSKGMFALLFVAKLGTGFGGECAKWVLFFKNAINTLITGVSLPCQFIEIIKPI